jgi:hypothetical protein
MGGGAGVVVGEFAGSVDCCGEAEGEGEWFGCGAGGDCASSDAERARLATAVKRIGAKLCMWL